MFSPCLRVLNNRIIRPAEVRIGRKNKSFLFHVIRFLRCTKKASDESEIGNPQTVIKISFYATNCVYMILFVPETGREKDSGIHNTESEENTYPFVALWLSFPLSTL